MLEKILFFYFVYDIVICTSLLQAVLRRNTASLALWSYYLHNIFLCCTVLNTEIQFCHLFRILSCKNYEYL